MSEACEGQPVRVGAKHGSDSEPRSTPTACCWHSASCFFNDTIFS